MIDHSLTATFYFETWFHSIDFFGSVAAFLVGDPFID
jgi:hypothetical protein